MQSARPIVAAHPLAFGRRRFGVPSAPVAELSARDDLKLFATTFAAGFLFVSVLIA